MTEPLIPVNCDHLLGQMTLIMSTLLEGMPALIATSLGISLHLSLIPRISIVFVLMTNKTDNKDTHREPPHKRKPCYAAIRDDPWSVISDNLSRFLT